MTCAKQIVSAHITKRFYITIEKYACGQLATKLFLFVEKRKKRWILNAATFFVFVFNIFIGV